MSSSCWGHKLILCQTDSLKKFRARMGEVRKKGGGGGRWVWWSVETLEYAVKRQILRVPRTPVKRVPYVRLSRILCHFRTL